MPRRSTTGLVRTALLSASALLAGTACADSPTPQPVSAADDLDAVPRLTLEFEQRIGSLDDPDQSLRNVGQVLIGPDERLYVAQPRDFQIWVYDRSGALLTRIGREGEGPGEFGSLSRIGLRADTLYVSDAELRRVTFFTLDGELIESITWLSEGIPSRDDRPDFAPGMPTYLLDDGAGILIPTRSGPATAPGPGAPREDLIPLARVERDGSRTEAIYWRRWPVAQATVSRSGSPMTLSCFWAARDLVELREDGGGILEVVVEPDEADPEAPRVHLKAVGPLGDTLFTRSLAYAPVAIPQSEVEARIEERRSSERRFGRDPPSTEAIRRALDEISCNTRTRVPVTDVLTGQDGSFWLRREAIPDDSVRWTLVNDRGSPRGEIRLDPRQRIVASAGDLMVLVELDEYDVPYVVRYRVREAEAG